MVPTALPNTRTKPRDSTASTVATNDPTACGVAEAPPATWLPEALASAAAAAMPPGGCLPCTAERYAGGGGAAFGGGTANVFASLPGPWCRQTLCAMVQRAVEVSVDAVTLLAPTPGGASGGGFAVNGTWHDHMRTQHSIGKRCKHMLRNCGVPMLGSNGLHITGRQPGRMRGIQLCAQRSLQMLDVSLRS